MSQNRSRQSLELDTLRQKIDALDRDLIALFEKRIQIAHEIAKVKANSQAGIYDPTREQDHALAMLRSVDPEHHRQAESFLSGMMRLSRSVQYEDRIRAGVNFEMGHLLNETKPSWPSARRAIIQGPSGAYSEQACSILFPDLVPMRAMTFVEACDAVRDQSADVAVLPLENSTAGTVDDVYELLLRDQLYIWRSLSLPIRHHLLVSPGTELDDIKVVLSHPQALAQCSDFIRSRGWSIRETLNTAMAAETVAQGKDRSVAAIASARAAQAWGLNCLRSDINNALGNQTRFVAVGRSFTVTPDAERVSLILKLPHTIGALASTLAVFSDRGLNLSKIQSRPDLDNPWAYFFYLDFECRQDTKEQAIAALYQLSCEMPFLRLLGWYGEILQSNT